MDIDERLDKIEEKHGMDIPEKYRKRIAFMYRKGPVFTIFMTTVLAFVIVMPMFFLLTGEISLFIPIFFGIFMGLTFWYTIKARANRIGL